MTRFSEIAITWGVGWLSGLLVSIPVGPINLTILHEGVQRGFWRAMLIGLGSLAMEVIYCFIGFTGFSEMFDSVPLRAAMELASFSLMLFLGLKYLLLPTLSARTKTQDQVEKRIHPHTAFMIGFVTVLANPGVLLGWIAISASFIAHEWVATTLGSKMICVSGVGVGALMWYVLLSFLVSRGQGRFSSQTLLRLSRLSGATLLIMALIIGNRIIRLLARR